MSIPWGSGKKKVQTWMGTKVPTGEEVTKAVAEMKKKQGWEDGIDITFDKVNDAVKHFIHSLLAEQKKEHQKEIGDMYEHYTNLMNEKYEQLLKAIPAKHKRPFGGTSHEIAEKVGYNDCIDTIKQNLGKTA